MSRATGGVFRRMLMPELDLHCETCGGTRTFKCTDEYGATLSKGHTLVFDEMNYECKNCKEGEKFKKRFCLAVLGDADSGPVQKIGEYPAYNPVTSRKVFDLIGENHRDMLLKGRRAELRGLGIERLLTIDESWMTRKMSSSAASKMQLSASGRPLTCLRYLLLPKRRISSQTLSRKSKTLFRERFSLAATIRSTFCTTS
jgi:hypothetical protein